MTKLRRIGAIAGVVLLVAAILVGGYLLRSRLPRSEAVEEEVRTGTVERGTLRDTLSLTASVQANERLDVSFLSTGEVASVNVAEGDYVQAGDVLLELDTSRAELDVREAEISLELQRLALEQLQNGPTDTQLASVQAAVWAAQIQYNAVTAPPSDLAVALAEAQVASVAFERDQAYDNYELVVDALGEGQIAALAFAEFQSAQYQVEQAERDRDALLEGATDTEIAQARAGLAQAQAALDAALSAATEIDISMLEAQIELAEMALDSAREALEDSQLVAPFDGLVTAVNVSVGEQVIPGLPVVTILDDSSYFLDVLVDEIDISTVVEGQPVVIVLDAVPGLTLMGEVDSIAPLSVNTLGVNTYPVRVVIEENEEVSLRDGLTATVDIVIAEAVDVLLVPNWALRIDRETGEVFASVPGEDGEVQEVPVTIGIRGSGYTEVVSGLSEGDEVFVSLERENVFESFFDTHGF